MSEPKVVGVTMAEVTPAAVEVVARGVYVGEDGQEHALCIGDMPSDALAEEVTAHIEQLAARNKQLEAELAEVKTVLADLVESSEPLVADLQRELVAARALAAQAATPLEFDDTVARLREVAQQHGWHLKSWGLQRLQGDGQPPR